jgi:hypothetical protein
MIPLNANGNVDNSDLVNYPGGRIRDNDGTNNGTGVNRSVYGDLHSTISKLMRLYAITPNGLPDNETNGFQLIEALRGLASKNDFIYPLSTNGTILNVDIKFSQMLDNEYVVCLAAFDKAAETQIKGIGAGTFAITYSGSFKTNEYVRVIKTSGGVSIIRIADALSLDLMVTELLFLKKASQVEEDAGIIDSKATTPFVNKTTFIKRVVGADSDSYLATAIRNGLYPKEHFTIVSTIGASPVKNKGWVSGVDPGIIGVVGLPVSGDIVSANTEAASPGVIVINLTFLNAMFNTNYKLVMSIESQGNILIDSTVGSVIFRPVSATTAKIAMSEYNSSVQNLKIHIEVVQL